VAFSRAGVLIDAGREAADEVGRNTTGKYAAEGGRTVGRSRPGGGYFVDEQAEESVDAVGHRLEACACSNSEGKEAGEVREDEDKDRKSAALGANVGQRLSRQARAHLHQQLQHPFSSSISPPSSPSTSHVPIEHPVHPPLPSSSALASSTEFARFEAHTTGFGSKLMARLGFVPGQGLGPEGEGIHEPLSSKQRPKHLGLGAE
jgi:hypothetical protein